MVATSSNRGSEAIPNHPHSGWFFSLERLGRVVYAEPAEVRQEEEQLQQNVNRKVGIFFIQNLLQIKICIFSYYNKI
jgi:hypothetical protein